MIYLGDSVMKKRFCMILVFLVSLLINSFFAESVKFEWVAHHDGLGGYEGCPSAIKLDSVGNVYVSGSSERPAPDPRWHGGIYNDILVIKYDAQGKQIWTIQEGEEGKGEGCAGLLFDDLGNLYVLGTLTAKYNSNGVKIWTPEQDDTVCSDGIFDGRGNIYLNTYPGVSKYTIQGKRLWKKRNIFNAMAPGPSGGFYTRSQKGGPARYDDNGRKLWDKANYMSVYNLISDNDGNVYILGFPDGLKIGGKPPVFDHLDIVKYDPNGREMWSVRYKSEHNTEVHAKSVSADDSGNIYAVMGELKYGFVIMKVSHIGEVLWKVECEGYFAVDSMIDNFGNIYAIGGVVEEDDLVLFKYNTNGRHMWTARYTDEPFSPSHLTVDKAGNVYVTGTGAYPNKTHFITLKYSQGESQSPRTRPKGTEKASPEQLLLQQIDKNTALIKQEKAFAKRIYKMMVKVKKQDESANLEDIVIDINMFDPDLYSKWGLGDKKGFSLEEKLYLFGLSQMQQAWEIYNSINLNELSEEEKNFLKKLHEEYGPGPINLREETRKKQGGLQPHQETWFDLVSAPSGHKKLNDVDLIFLYRMTPR